LRVFSPSSAAIAYHKRRSLSVCLSLFPLLLVLNQLVDVLCLFSSVAQRLVLYFLIKDISARIVSKVSTNALMFKCTDGRLAFVLFPFLHFCFFLSLSHSTLSCILFPVMSFSCVARLSLECIWSQSQSPLPSPPLAVPL
jgi:hypothetical protein